MTGFTLRICRELLGIRESFTLAKIKKSHEIKNRKSLKPKGLQKPETCSKSSKKTAIKYSKLPQKTQKIRYDQQIFKATAINSKWQPASVPQVLKYRRDRGVSLCLFGAELTWRLRVFAGYIFKKPKMKKPIPNWKLQNLKNPKDVNLCPLLVYTLLIMRRKNIDTIKRNSKLQHNMARCLLSEHINGIEIGAKWATMAVQMFPL